MAPRELKLSVISLLYIAQIKNGLRTKFKPLKAILTLECLPNFRFFRIISFFSSLIYACTQLISHAKL
jgi:hypothetical protein